MSVMVLIPSRMASTRFPNKPLADILGTPMVVRVLQQAAKANAGPVYAAVSEQDVADVVKAAGFDYVMTDAALPSGSDRIWQGVQRLMERGVPQPEIIINAQGDEPLLPPELITECVAAFKRLPDADVITYAHKITDESDINNPTKVKVVIALNGQGLYFSRSPIPHNATEMWRHVGFYGYRYSALEKYVAQAPTPLQKQEDLEQLRGLEIGLKYYVLPTEHEPVGVDTQADLERVKGMLSGL
ncbi:MAG: 3-deoxy-manno-octulosonate cytidylyltransferase [Alphaproteobacteria bacterium]|nr:MAG: 3-deoxy-manno-octulosonate cytidylyltransferase [Alphaproteobacteria bacterium]